jgi:putative ATP-dependent endonuclease of OLD family
MYISRIVVRNFRNLQNIDLEVEDGVTCFVGENNCGKSNLFYALRLVLDGTISAARRRLNLEDLSVGLTFAQPEHVLISVEFRGFAGNEVQEALPFGGVVAEDRARITYRFRPNPKIRVEVENNPKLPVVLKLDDYRWELVGGGPENIDFRTITWDQNFGQSFSTENLQQGYLVVLMEAIRDVDASLQQSRYSPLTRIIEQRQIPESEKELLVAHLREANENIGSSSTLLDVGDQITLAFKRAVGSVFGMDVAIGLGEPSFADISRSLRVLLTGYGLQNVDPRRNGLGLNNVLFIAMLLSYFEMRKSEGKTAGEILLIEEPEAHLHPQLQRVLLNALKDRGVQILISTHSTHVTSSTRLRSSVILTSNGAPVSTAVCPALIPNLTPGDHDDLERYLDATRSTLLFARGVLLVEGPAEQFLIPPLVRRVMGIDLDEKGISVVPIYGTHFGAYARLFGPDGIQKKCAIAADGDLEPSDAVGAEEDVDEDAVPAPENLASLENPWVRVFQSSTTLEREITLQANLAMLAKAAREIGAPVVARKLETAAQSRSPRLDELGAMVLRTAKRFGKARFSQVASKNAQLAGSLPEYISDAVNWLVAP